MIQAAGSSGGKGNTNRRAKLELEFGRMNNALQRIGKDRLPDEVTIILRRVAMQLLTNVILLTPVNTGQARAAWVAALTDEHIKGQAPGGWQGGTSNQNAIAQGMKLGTVRAQLTGSKQYIEITNAVRHILSLELGHAPYTVRPIEPGGRKTNPFEFPSVRKEKPPRGWLRFKGPGGRVVFAREVKIPAHPGFHMLRKAMADIRLQLNKAVKERKQQKKQQQGK